MAYATPVNLTGITEIFQYAEKTTGVFGIGILVSLFFIITLSLKMRGEDLPDSLAAAGFITSITSVLLFVMNIGINSYHVIVCVLLFALSAIWAYYDKA